MSRPEPVFVAPWHADAFAMAVHLEAQGVFSWPDWVAVFSRVLAEQGVAKDLDGGDDYFLAWVTALERILSQRSVAAPDELLRLKASWAEAYLSTPHGQPVRLA